MTTEAENNVSFFRFEDLRIYAKALGYINWVHQATSTFPENVQASLTNKFVITTQTIALHIAEGSARNKSQFIYYLKMAKSSVRECVVFTTLAGKLNYLTPTQVDESRGQLMEMTKMIGALIGSLQRSADMSPEDPD